MNVKRKDHWENVYAKKAPAEVSWYQMSPALSLELIALTGINHCDKIIDVGGGASVLVDKLLDNDYTNLTVLDISSKAIHYAKERLGKRAEEVSWIVSDVTEFEPPCSYDLWHDRAVFHFLTDSQDRRKYVDVMKKALRSDGHVIISAFSLQGPSQCSGLNVERYNEQKMQDELGKTFGLIKSMEEVHVTPWKTEQNFIYCYFKKR